jgi:FlaG/FlaF family flagellin (archaellin)
VVVSLDNLPLARSRRMLLQAMTEERATGFETEPAGDGLLRIKHIGKDPWQVRSLSGTLRFHRENSRALKFTRLDLNGRTTAGTSTGNSIELDPATIYYLIEAP